MFSSLVIGVPDENIFGHRCTCLKYIWQGSILFNVEVNFVDIINIPWFIWLTRSCAALRAADLDWIVGPEYSLGGEEEGGQGRNKQKRYWRGVTTDLLDV